jgi:hypothetical protein
MSFNDHLDGKYEAIETRECNGFKYDIKKKRDDDVYQIIKYKIENFDSYSLRSVNFMSTKRYEKWSQCNC